ncbi:MAG: hypothetical protein AVDCRST_MAG22-3071, partial [uncultured Rubrobacteraceae bacterium]
ARHGGRPGAVEAAPGRGGTGDSGAAQAGPVGWDAWRDGKAGGLLARARARRRAARRGLQDIPGRSQAEGSDV